MSGFIDLAGQRFGQWQVVALHSGRDVNIRWTCQCTCGVTRPVLSSSLRRGRSTSCGCVWRRFSDHIREREAGR
jgi:hypothetical protein